FSYVTRIGSAEFAEEDPLTAAPDYKPLDIEMSDVRCPDDDATEAMKAAIDAAREAGESLGGTFRVVVLGLLPGIGGYATPTERLTSRIGAALFSIPAIKGVEFGLGFAAAASAGSKVHDPITQSSKDGFSRASNNAGGLEGGMTTGMPLIVTAAMKPIPTLTNPLMTVNMDTLEPEEASKERSDVCAVPACAVVAESEVAFVLANAYLERFGDANMTDIRAAVKAYRQRIKTMSR
ncbi:chorismate synthase, partial [Raoultibacter timonensis]